jgi:hypothetical protein
VTEVERLCRAGVRVRIRRGAYVERTLWTARTAEGRHRAIVHAVILSLVEPAVASHVAASVINGLPTWGYDLSTVVVADAAFRLSPDDPEALLRCLLSSRQCVRSPGEAVPHHVSRPGPARLRVVT